MKDPRTLFKQAHAEATALAGLLPKIWHWVQVLFLLVLIGLRKKMHVLIGIGILLIGMYVTAELSSPFKAPSDPEISFRGLTRKEHEERHITRGSGYSITSYNVIEWQTRDAKGTFFDVQAPISGKKLPSWLWGDVTETRILNEIAIGDSLFLLRWTHGGKMMHYFSNRRTDLMEIVRAQADRQHVYFYEEF